MIEEVKKQAGRQLNPPPAISVYLVNVISLEVLVV